MFLEKRERAIKTALKIRNINQKELARDLKISTSYVTRLINGTRYSRKFEYVQIRQVYSVGRRPTRKNNQNLVA